MGFDYTVLLLKIILPSTSLNNVTSFDKSTIIYIIMYSKIRQTSGAINRPLLMVKNSLIHVVPNVRCSEYMR